MYVFKDRVVLECLHRTVSAYGRIGEYIRVDATPASVEFSVVNSSATVVARAAFPAPLFAGPGATRTVLLKARALDLVLRRVEADELGTLRLRFRTSRAGQEQAEILLVEPSGASKQFRINCLETVVLPVDFADASPAACTFACLPAVLKDAFASCEQSADEARMQFMPQHVSILAKRRGGGAAAGAGAAASVLSMGLKTTVRLPPTAFRQLAVLTPWQAEFKLKEFRVMLAFLWQLSAETPLSAAFDVQGPTTPFVFRTTHPVCPQLTFVFKFMARVSTVRHAEANTWLRVGPQADAAAPAPAPARGLDAARRERAARVRRITAGLAAPAAPAAPAAFSPGGLSPPRASASPLSAQSPAASAYAADTADDAAPGSGASAYGGNAYAGDALEARDDAAQAASPPAPPAAASDDELGFTQAEPVARGLFD